MLTTVLNDVGFGDLAVAHFQLDEGARSLAPLVVGLGHDRRLFHRRVGIQRVFNLDSGDVLAAGNDDVLGAILDLDVTVGMPHSQVSGVVPASGQRLFGGNLVLQIAFHHVV